MRDHAAIERGRAHQLEIERLTSSENSGKPRPNEDGTEINGTWRVSVSWSGTFLMIRQRAIATALSRETAERT